MHTCTCTVHVTCIHVHVPYMYMYRTCTCTIHVTCIHVTCTIHVTCIHVHVPFMYMYRTCYITCSLYACRNIFAVFSQSFSLHSRQTAKGDLPSESRAPYIKTGNTSINNKCMLQSLALLF